MKTQKAEIALSFSYKDNLEAGELIKFLARIRKGCNYTEDTDVFFGSRVTKITKRHFRPITIVKQQLAAYPNNDVIWDSTNPCDVYLDNKNDTEALANVDVTKESIVTTTTFMSTKDDKIWYNANEECDSWHDVPETMDNYKEWDDPPIILKDTSIKHESSKEYIEPDFYIGKHQT